MKKKYIVTPKAIYYKDKREVKKIKIKKMKNGCGCGKKKK